MSRYVAEFHEERVYESSSEDSTDGGGGCGERRGSDAQIQDPEDWQAEFEEELLALWDVLRSACQQMGPVLDTCTFNAFATFAFENSSRFRSRV